MLDFMKDNECVFYLNDFRPHKGPATCEPVWNKIMELTKDLNWYDLYRVGASPLTLKGEDRYATAMVGGEEKRYKRGRTIGEYTPWLKHVTSSDKVYNDLLSDYVNRADVREALHIPQEVQGWDECWNED